MKKQQSITVVVENPKGSCNNYRKEEGYDYFTLTRVMPKGMSFPSDFGYILDTVSSNGKPLQAIIIGDCQTFVGCRINCRIIGGLLSTEITDDGNTTELPYLLAMPLVDGIQQIKTISELSAIVLENLKSFLINYYATAGKKLKFSGKLGATEALKIVNNARTEQNIKLKFELVLPQTDSNGKPFPQELFEELNRELIKKFGGLTVYSRLPAQGFWKNNKTTVQQTVIVYQLMLTDLDDEYWLQLKTKLETKFKQTEVMMTYGPSRQIK